MGQWQGAGCGFCAIFLGRGVSFPGVFHIGSPSGVFVWFKNCVFRHEKVSFACLAKPSRLGPCGLMGCSIVEKSEKEPVGRSVPTVGGKPPRQLVGTRGHWPTPRHINAGHIASSTANTRRTNVGRFDEWAESFDTLSTAGQCVRCRTRPPRRRA